MESRFDKLDGKVDDLGHGLSDARERLARIEGCLMTSEDFRKAVLQPPASAAPSADDPPPDHRTAD